MEWTKFNKPPVYRDIGDSQTGSGDSGIGTHLGADVCDNRSIVATSYSHWETLSDKDSVSLQVRRADS